MVKRPLDKEKTIKLGEDLHDRLTNHYAPKIAEAMQDVDGLEEAIEEARKIWPVKKADNETPPVAPTPAAGFTASQSIGPLEQEIAVSAVSSHVTFDTQKILDVLQDLYGDAGLAGAGVAGKHLGTDEGSDFTDVLPQINWSEWHPGDLPAAQEVANGNLRRVLDNKGIVLRGLYTSAVDRMGNVLANGLNEGLPPATIAQQMRDIVADPKRAMVIARTETARAQVASSMDSYAANNVQEVDWHSNTGACPACIALDEGSPYPIEDAPDFPHHPNDRCQVLPHVDLKDLGIEDDYDLSDFPQLLGDSDSIKGVMEKVGPKGYIHGWIYVGPEASHDARYGKGDVKLSDDDIKALRSSTAGAHMDEHGNFTPERKALHDKIVSDLTSKATGQRTPRMVMMGGGPASGKSSMISAGKISLDNAVHVDPDQIKQMLPEVKDMKEKGDDRWAALSHEESSYLAKRVLQASLEQRKNVLLDGTGDSSVAKLTGKIAAAKAHGYKVDGHYSAVTIDTALQRAEARAQKSGRRVPEQTIRDTYANISKVLPEAMHNFDSLNIYDNNGTSLRLIAHHNGGGKLNVLDKDAYTAFLENAKG